MGLSEAELLRLAGALLALLIASQVLGSLFARARQPRVIGEIAGGLLFGPTVLGAWWPAAHDALFGGPAPHGQILAFVFWLGLMLLMFCTGLEGASAAGRREWRLVAWIAGVGTLLPLAAGWWLASHWDFSTFFGPRATALSFGLVFANAIAITSIPVIGKIFLDLGLVGTSFARVVLSAAMIEDVLLWILLSITLGLAKSQAPDAGGLLLGVLATVFYFVACQVIGPRLYDAIARARWNPLRGAAPGAPLLLVLLSAVLLAYALGVNPIFGAFVAGRVVATASVVEAETRRQIAGFGFALFIPLYFASVGLKLDLRAGFDWRACLAIVAIACLVKAGAVYLGSRLGGEGQARSAHLAVAMNARGGPGIVLAAVTLEAGLIAPGFYAILIVLALVTSQLAGWWLERALRRTPEALGTPPLLTQA